MSDKEEEESSAAFMLLVEWVRGVNKDLISLENKIDQILKQTAPKPRRAKQTLLKIDPNNFPLPQALDTKRFRKALELWKRHRAEKRSALTEKTLKSQLKKMATMGEDRAIEAIKFTVFKGWIGLREPDGIDLGPGNSVPVNKI